MDTRRRVTRRRENDATDQATKRFHCEQDGCGKSFTRSEHLQRHLLNHTNGDETCPRCSAHFKRRDLLDRHMARHKQKDEEAGLEGAGVLNTRKRMWKDSDGNIVTKRPSLSNPQPEASEHAHEVSHLLPDFHEFNHGAVPISPPTSASNSGSSTHQRPPSQDAQPIHDDSWGPSILHIGQQQQQQQVLPVAAQEGFWASGAVAGNDQQVYGGDVPYDDMFNPDTASSFNQPYTTMSNYNWLFDLNAVNQQYPIAGDLGLLPPDVQQQPLETPPVDSAHPSSFSDQFFDIASNQTLSTSGPDRSPRMFASGPGSYQTSEPMTFASAEYFGLQGLPEPLRPIPATVPAAARQGTSRTTASDSGEQSRGNISQAQSQASGSAPRKRKLATPFVDFERPLSMLQCSRALPKIDEVARILLLDTVLAAKPTTPDGTIITRVHPLLSLSALQTNCDLYFTHFNTAYPLVHQPTFEPAGIEPLLLISVLLVGATYGEKDGHQLAVCIHDVLRPQIFANSAFSAKPELWVLQTILLTECFGKSRAGQKQHDMAHLFHGLLINLIRRSDCQTVRPPGPDEETECLEEDWRNWAIAEQKKRLAFLCFLWDVQHAVLFCQSLCMSAFELRSTLPCNQSVWEADSAESWQQLRRKQKPAISYLPLLKSYLTGGSPPRDTNALSRVLLLHGLMSVAWDMSRRDQTSLGVIGSEAQGIGNWKARLSCAYETWKGDFDSFAMSYKAALSPAMPQVEAMKREFASYITAYNAIYHSAQVILNADFLDLQIYAGARHILGRPVGKADYVRSQRVVRSWASTNRTASAKATWHAASLLKDGIVNLDDFDAMGIFHYPWCLYLATVTVWAFWHARPTGSSATTADRSNEYDEDDERGHDHGDDDEMIWDAKGEMNTLINRITSASPESLAAMGGRKRTAGLTAVISRTLSKIRWAIVHDGMMVLRGLVPWRLINQEESF